MVQVVSQAVTQSSRTGKKPKSESSTQNAASSRMRLSQRQDASREEVHQEAKAKGAGASEEDSQWEEAVVNDPAIRASLMEYYAMRLDPWDLDPAPKFFLEFAQTAINVRYPDCDYTLRRSSHVYKRVCSSHSSLIQFPNITFNQLRQSIYDWHRLFLQCATNHVGNVLVANELMRKAKRKFITVDPDGVKGFIKGSNKDNSMFYSKPDRKVSPTLLSVKLSDIFVCYQHPRGMFLSQYVLATFSEAYLRKTTSSFLEECFENFKPGYPLGALQLTVFAVSSESPFHFPPRSLITSGSYRLQAVQKWRLRGRRVFTIGRRPSQALERVRWSRAWVVPPQVGEVH